MKATILRRKRTTPDTMTKRMMEAMPVKQTTALARRMTRATRSRLASGRSDTIFGYQPASAGHLASFYAALAKPATFFERRVYTHAAMPSTTAIKIAA